MDEFLNELRELLVKHKATIVRSATEQGELVAVIGRHNATFEEEIGETHIRNRWWVDSLGPE